MLVEDLLFSRRRERLSLDGAELRVALCELLTHVIHDSVYAHRLAMRVRRTGFLATVRPAELLSLIKGGYMRTIPGPECRLPEGGGESDSASRVHGGERQTVVSGLGVGRADVRRRPRQESGLLGRNAGVTIAHVRSM